MTATTGYVFVTHTLPEPAVRPIAPAMLAHRPALSPMDLNYRTRSQVFVAKRQRRPHRVPMVSRWTRRSVAS
jgi:hypothetical protein